MDDFRRQRVYLASGRFLLDALALLRWHAGFPP